MAPGQGIYTRSARLAIDLPLHGSEAFRLLVCLKVRSRHEGDHGRRFQFYFRTCPCGTRAFLYEGDMRKYSPPREKSEGWWARGRQTLGNESTAAFYACLPSTSLRHEHRLPGAIFSSIFAGTGFGFPIMTRLSLWRDTASTYTIMMGVVGKHTSFPFCIGDFSSVIMHGLYSLGLQSLDDVRLGTDNQGLGERCIWIVRIRRWGGSLTLRLGILGNERL